MLASERQNFISQFPVGMVVTTLLLFGFGATTLYSASQGPGLHSLFKIQVVWFFIGVALATALVFVDSENFSKGAYLFYGVVLVLLGLVLVIGRVGGGSQRWIDLKFFHLQPSELAKLAVILVLARFYSEDKVPPPYTLKRLIIPALLVIPYFVLIVKQPDMGTAGIVFLTASTVTLFARVHWKSLMTIVIIGMIGSVLAYHFALHDYQKERVKNFLNPGRDPKATGYNALQCKIAVGSGKVFGKGYLKGTQAQLNFIPEQQTDFIFSVLAEERGLVGAAVLLALYLFYLSFALRAVKGARDKFEMFTAMGCAGMMFWHVFINIGMVIGIVPIVGVTLPFFSYGGSSLLTFIFATALLVNIGRKRYIF